ncbi:hypothetical protein AB8616_09775 [Marinomonas sp. RS-M-Aa-14]|uniref:hypothetical protein n=1 Tax=Marinomonas sp. RS-M-Aa-14 TaxID=3241169 RepID=UPI003AAFDD4E
MWGINSGTPSSSLPEQLQNAAKAWATWRNTNGISEAQPNLAKQLICHSLIATINWQGKDIAYGTGDFGEESNTLLLLWVIPELRPLLPIWRIWL